jgi:stearoyl-CoA desaturase (delta-9 desaturase)
MDKTRIEPGILIFLVAIHAAALGLGIAFATWPGALAGLVLYVVTGLGVTIGYHRRLTHQSFDAPPWVDKLLAVAGLLSGEGPPVFWVAHHRQHHKYSDAPGDPHSPNQGFWWAHWLWLLPRRSAAQRGALYLRWAPDLLRGAFYRRLEDTYLLWHVACAAAIVAAGWALGSWRMAMSFLAYGFFVRMVVVLHATWMVNSVTHSWGYRTYQTTDCSRNNPLVALVSIGEGWHNNHHHEQVAANHGHRWWEIDISFLVIAAAAALCWPLKAAGLAKWRPVSAVRYYSWRAGRTRIWCR